MATVGNLVFEMSANVARLRDDMDKAKATVETAMSGIRTAAGYATTALGALGIAASVNGLKNMVTGAIESIDALHQMSIKTGVAVEQLSALRGVAKLSGTDMETVATSVFKLEKNMLEFARGGGGKAANAFADLGISSKQAKTALESGDIAGFMQLLATRMEATGNGAINAARAQELMGKSAAQAMPFMKELARTGELNAKVTTEQAEAAHQFEQNMVKLQAGSNQLKLELAKSLLPALNDITNAMIQAKKESGLLMSLWVALGGAAHSAVEGITGGDAGRLKSTQNDIAQLQKQIADLDNRPAGAAAATMRARIGLQTQLNAKISEEVQIANRLAAAGELGEKMGKAARPKPSIEERPEKATGGSSVDKKTEYEREIERLDKLSIQERHLTELMQERQKILLGTFGPLKAGEEAELERKAKIADALREQLKIKKETDEAVKKMTEFADNLNKKEADHLKSMTEHYKDMIDPIEKYRKQLQEIDMLLEKGKLSFGEWQEAAMKINDQIDAAAGIGKEIKKTDDWTKQLGLTFESAFEKMAIGGGKARDVIRGLAQDIAKMILRKTVTEPLGNAVSGMISNLNWGSIFGGGKASGGPVAGGTPYLVGENGPELMVPSSSGTIIPNEQMGGGGVTIVQHMSFGSDVNRATLAAWADRVKRDTMMAVADARLRGGSYSSAMGR